ncbi:MAG TPA: S8 family serine peptidase [Phycisphaerae bacterium]|nr:S8 family serine peptidase [Phycisphaerae bacterium]
MKSTRRKGLFHNLAVPIRQKRAPKQFPQASLLDHLESRLLLSTATLTWNGASVSAVANEYIVRTGAGNGVMFNLPKFGLRASSVKDLGFGDYLVTDTADSVGYVQYWSTVNKGLFYSFSPNVVHEYARLPTEANDGANWPARWYYQNTGQTITSGSEGTVAGTPGADIDMPNAWNIATGSQTTYVAVIDSGVDYTSPDLAANIWTNPGEIAGDGIDNDLDGIVDDVHGANFGGTGAPGDPMDVVGHGTLVAGLVGAVANNDPPGSNAQVGVNWNTTIVAVRAGDATGLTDSAILQAINYVILLKTLRGVPITVMNMSFGGAYDGPQNGVGDPGVAAIYDAIDRAGQDGIISVTAAGNSSLDHDTVNSQPASSVNALNISVAATDNRDNLAPFSDYGATTVDLAAPGVGITSTGNVNEDGTSFSAPLVTGAVALLHSLVPNATPTQLVNAILQGVDVLPQLKGKVITGGRLDVAKSLEILLGDQQVQSRIEVVNNQTISGWMYDPNLGAASVIGEVLIDGHFFTTFVANQARQDLNAAFGSPNHGFSVTLPGLTANGHTIQVYALNVYPDAGGNIRHIFPSGTVNNPHNLNDTNSAYNMNPVLVTNIAPNAINGGTGGNSGGTITINGNVPPRGFVDFADPNHIVGWAFDPQAGPLPVNVIVYIDGKLVASGSADKNRPDLTVLGLGSINHGFDIATPTNLTIGPHRVSVYALDTTTGQPFFIGSRTLLENAPLNFFVDNAVGSYNFTGWVYNPDTPNATISLEIDVDGVRQAFYPTQASLNRADVPISNLNHGFDITIAQLDPGTHFVQLIAYHNETGTKTVIAARNLVGNRLPIGSFAVNNQNITGFVYDQDTPATPISYRVDVDGNSGTVATGTEGTGSLVGPIVNTPVAPVLPNITGTSVLDITQFGADGSLVHDTFALQTAINDASALAGGGTVVVNGAYSINPITLRSNVILDIEGTLTMAPNGTYTGSATTALLSGTNIINFELIGAGRINGGTGFGATGNGPGLLQINGGDRILIDGVTFSASPGTAVFFGTTVVNNALTGTNDVTVLGAQFNLSQNTTGMVIQGHNYLVDEDPVLPVPQTTFTNGAQQLQISAQSVNCNNIMIRNTNFSGSTGWGLQLGPNTTHGIDTVVVDTVQFTQTRYAFRINSTRATGGIVQNIQFSNATLANVANPLIISEVSTGGLNDAALTAANPATQGVTDTTPYFQNILLDTWTVTNSPVAGLVFGLPESRIAGITFRALTYTPALPTRTMRLINTIGWADDGSIGFTYVQTNSIEMNSDVFYYNLTTPLLSAGTHNFALYAIDPINGDNILVRTATLVVPTLSRTNNQPVGAITGTTTSAVVGYAIDPDSANPVQVEVDVDGTSIGDFAANRFQANLPFQFGPNHGFAVPLSLSVGRHVVAVYALDLTDPTQKVFIGSTVITKGPSPVGVITLARGDFLVASASAFTTQPAGDWTFRFDVDGHTGNTVTATSSGAIGSGVVSVAIKTPPVDPTKPHTVVFEYIDPLTLIPTPLATAVIPASTPFIGGVTIANNNFLAGSLYSLTIPSVSLNLFLASDTLPIQIYKANIVLPNIGPHGFFIPTIGTPAGTHRLTLFAIDPATGLYRQVFTTIVTIPQP